MYKRILVPTDGSDLSLQALPYARLVGNAVDANLDLVRVVPATADLMQKVAGTDDGQWGMGYDDWERVAIGLREEATADLQQTAGALSLNGKEAGTLIFEGDPAECIVREGAKAENSMIVMTTHGRSGITRWWLGSVADKVVRHASTPVLVVRTHEASPSRETATLRSLLVPLDGSELAERAVAHAMSLAKVFKLNTTLVRAVDPLASFEEHFDSYRELLDRLQIDAQAYLSKIVDRFRNEGINTTSLVMTGTAADVILEIRDRMENPLVVMATHGRSGIGRWLLGSVTDKACGVLKARY